MRARRAALYAGFLGLALPTPAARAVDIDFESIPGIGTPVDRMEINTHFLTTAGVVFTRADGSFPKIARVGAPATAFNGPGGSDGPAVGQPVGQYFLTDNEDFENAGPALLIDFVSGPVDFAAGEILDIDVAESWIVTAIDLTDVDMDGTPEETELASLTLDTSTPGAGDGLATPWSFTRASPDVDRIRIELDGPGSGIGVAFDNFSFSSTGVALPPSEEVIDFEAIPGLATPRDRMDINTHFQATHGVSFFLEDDGVPVGFPELASPGLPLTAFLGPPNHTGNDNPLDAAQGVESFFLTDDGIIADMDPPLLVIEYDPPAEGASGVILDVDFDETYAIQAYDANDQPIAGAAAQISSGALGTGDGIASEWSIDAGAAVIYRIRVDGSREESGGFGLGFDRFDARAPAGAKLPVLSPGWTLALVAALAASVPLARRRRGS
jgi:hypothetical protein